MRTSDVHSKKGEPRMFEGIWLGTNARTEETFVGTEKGVVKCRTVQRLPEASRWDPRLATEMVGTTWKPVPGHQSDHVPVEIKADGSPTKATDEEGAHVETNRIPTEEGDRKDPEIKKSNVTDIRVSHKDLVKLGVTPGCPACTCFTDNRKIPPGMSHSDRCRVRIRKNIQEDDDVQDRIAKADTRQKRDKVQSSLGKAKGVKTDSSKHIGKLEK